MIKKASASIGTGLLIIPVTIFIALVLIFHIFLTLGIFAKTEITDTTNVEIKTSKVDSKLTEKLISFLDIKIVINDNEEKIMDAIGYSLEPFFDVKNDDDENFFEHFDPVDLSPKDGESKSDHFYRLQGEVEDKGFDLGEILSIISKYSESERYREISKVYDRLCDISNNDRYDLEIPIGLIEKPGESVFFKSRERSKVLVRPVVVSGLYRGERYDVKLFSRRGCI